LISKKKEKTVNGACVQCRRTTPAFEKGEEKRSKKNRSKKAPQEGPKVKPKLFYGRAGHPPRCFGDEIKEPKAKRKRDGKKGAFARPAAEQKKKNVFLTRAKKKNGGEGGVESDWHRKGNRVSRCRQ